MLQYIKMGFGFALGVILLSAAIAVAVGLFGLAFSLGLGISPEMNGILSIIAGVSLIMAGLIAIFFT